MLEKDEKYKALEQQFKAKENELNICLKDVETWAGKLDEQ